MTFCFSWDGSVTLLDQFLGYINRDTMFNLKFTMSYSPSTILDLTIQKHSDGYLYSELFRKPTPFLMPLASTPNHYWPLVHMGNTFGLGATARVMPYLEKEAQVLRSRLHDRGYSNSILKKAKVRTDLLFSHKKN